MDHITQDYGIVARYEASVEARILKESFRTCSATRVYSRRVERNATFADC